MRRPLIWITVGYITGIIWGLYLKISIVPIFLLFGGIVTLFIKTEIIKEYKFFMISFIIFGLISNIHIMYLEKKHNNLYKEVKDVEIIGTVISEKKETTYKSSYTIRVEKINENKKFKRTNLIIYIPKDIELKYGNEICFKGEYVEAKGASNYKAFDYREYLKTKNIYGIVTSKGSIEILKEKNLNPILTIIYTIRTKIKLNLKEILGEKAEITIGILLRRYIWNPRRSYTKF